MSAVIHPRHAGVRAGNDVMRAPGGLRQMHVRECHTGISLSGIAGAQRGISCRVATAGPHNLRFNAVIHQHLEQLPAPGLVIHTMRNRITAEHDAPQGVFLSPGKRLRIILRFLVIRGIQSRRSLDTQRCHVVGIHRIGVRGIKGLLGLEIGSMEKHLSSTAHGKPLLRVNAQEQPDLPLPGESLQRIIFHHAIPAPGLVSPVTGEMPVRIRQAIHQLTPAGHTHLPRDHGTLLVVIRAQVTFQSRQIKHDFQLPHSWGFHVKATGAIINHLVLCIAELVLHISVISSSGTHGQSKQHAYRQTLFHFAISGVK